MSTTEKIRITGKGGVAYVLGTPMCLYDGDVHIGTLDPVPVNKLGTEVHVEHFTPAAIPGDRKVALSKLVLVEMVLYLAENFNSVQAISVALGREIEGYGDAVRLADARSIFLENIGASHIKMTPKPNGEHMGHFVVSGVWIYNPSNFAALTEVVQAERDTYFGAQRANGGIPKPSRLNALVKRLTARN